MIQTPWVTIFGERLEGPAGETMDYWRVKKPDSVIVLPLHRGRILLPEPQYRHGLGRSTWDLPGGRLPQGVSARQTAREILIRELGARAEDQIAFTCISGDGWPINSSFSNQLLHAYCADFANDSPVPTLSWNSGFPADQQGVETLLGKIDCLQCRAVLLQWLSRFDLR